MLCASICKIIDVHIAPEVTFLAESYSGIKYYGMKACLKGKCMLFLGCLKKVVTFYGIYCYSKSQFCFSFQESMPVLMCIFWRNKTKYGENWSWTSAVHYATFVSFIYGFSSLEILKSSIQKWIVSNIRTVVAVMAMLFYFPPDASLFIFNEGFLLFFRIGDVSSTCNVT